MISTAPVLPSRTASIAALVALSLTAACSQPGLFASVAHDPGPPASRVSVVQSDLLLIDNKMVRLADAVTPQASPDAHCAAEALAARQAALRLKELAQGMRVVTMTLTGEKDASNQPYAHVLLDGVDPAHELIEDGLAVRPGKSLFNWCAPISADFPRAEHIAALSNSGT